jgi:hypothetical protein
MESKEKNLTYCYQQVDYLKIIGEKIIELDRFRKKIEKEVDAKRSRYAIYTSLVISALLLTYQFFVNDWHFTTSSVFSAPGFLLITVIIARVTYRLSEFSWDKNLPLTHKKSVITAAKKDFQIQKEKIENELDELLKECDLTGGNIPHQLINMRTYYILIDFIETGDARNMQEAIQLAEEYFEINPSEREFIKKNNFLDKLKEVKNMEFNYIPASKRKM